MQWLASNSQWLNVLINAGMLLVWMFYAQLLLNNYRRARRPKIIIDNGVGSGLGSLCLIANMSTEAVFVQVVAAALYNEEDRISRDITDLKIRERGGGDDGQDGVSRIQAQTVQGPLQAGSYLDIGTFGEVIDTAMHKRVSRSESDDERHHHADAYSLEITVIATFGPENQPIGARRRFEFSRSETGEHLVRPTTVDTRRMSGLRDRRQMRRWLQQYL